MRRILFLSLLVFVIAGCQSRKVSLSINLEEGKEYSQIMSAKSTINQEYNGQEINMVMYVQGGLSYKVTSVEPSYFDMDVQYDSLAMAMETPYGDMSFNSNRNDSADILSNLLSKMSGVPFNIKMGKTGEIFEVNGIDSLFESLFEGFPEITEERKAQIITQMEDAYGDKVFKGNISMATAIFPDHPVEIGDTWQMETDLMGGFPAKIYTEYKLIELTDEYAMINGTSTIESVDKDEYFDFNNTSMKMDIQGNMTSEMKVDRKTGWIITAIFMQDYQGIAHLKLNPLEPQVMEVPMKFEIEMGLKDQQYNQVK